MATGRNGQWTMPSGDAGSPIGHMPLGMQVETAMGAWMVRPLHGAPLGVGEASEGRTDGAQMSSLIAIQSSV